MYPILVTSRLAAIYLRGRIHTDNVSPDTAAYGMQRAERCRFVQVLRGAEARISSMPSDPDRITIPRVHARARPSPRRGVAHNARLPLLLFPS